MVLDELLCEENELLILYKTYPTKDGVSHLTAPTKELAEVTDTILTCFYENFNRLKHMEGIKRSLVMCVTKRLMKNHREWLKLNSECREHRRFFIDFAVRLKIIKTVLWTSRSIRMSRYMRKSSKTLQKQKINNFQNM